MQNKKSINIKNIEIEGAFCWINITAHVNNRTISGYQIFDVSHLKVSKPQSRLFHVLFYTFVTIVAIFLVVLLRLWQSRINSIVRKFSQKQLDNMDLDLIKSITNRSMLEAIADLTRDEAMEIERENVTVLEALGEGAFGLVKKAILMKADVKHQVAVKMLKSKTFFSFS